MPFHSSDRQRSLRVQVHSGRFVCFACGAWGYMDTARERWREEQQRQAAVQRPPAYRQRVPHCRQPPPRVPRQPVAATRKLATDPSTPRAPAPSRPDLAQQLAVFQAALPGSWGDTYLQQRGISLELAQQHGVGYAAPGTWPHTVRDWRGGRVVFPHTTPDGRLVNLYGRAVGTAEEVPKAKRHDHLPGEKGYFNAAALQAGAGPLWVCEGAFDALALLAADIPRVVAIFGVQGWRWDWVREICALVFALDADIAGQQQWRQLARQAAALRGKRVATLPTRHMEGAKTWARRGQQGDCTWGSGLPQETRSQARFRTTAVRTGPSARRSWWQTGACRPPKLRAWRGEVSTRPSVTSPRWSCQRSGRGTSHSRDTPGHASAGSSCA